MKDFGSRLLVVAAALLALCWFSSGAYAGVDNDACRRFLVDERVYVAVQFGPDGVAGGITWTDTVSGRRGEALFAAGDGSILQVEMPGGWCSRAFFLENLALLFRNPPWDPEATRVALGVSLD
jgi:hypothetical protein